MFLNKIEDPRDNLEKARRPELIEFAKVNGIAELTIAGIRASVDHPAVGAILLREALRARGLTQIPSPNRKLGAQNQPNVRPMYQNGLAVPRAAPRQQPDQPTIAQVNATADLARQFLTEQAIPLPQPIKPARPPKYPPRLVQRPKSKINQMRDYCKEHGIKMDRRDRMPDLERKIEAHKSGQDAPQLRQ